MTNSNPIYHFVGHQQTRPITEILTDEVISRYASRYGASLNKLKDLDVTLIWSDDADFTLAHIFVEIGRGRRSRVLSAIGHAVRSINDSPDDTTGWRIAATRALEHVCRLMESRGETKPSYLQSQGWYFPTHADVPTTFTEGPDDRT